MITESDAKKFFETGVRQELEGYVYEIEYAEVSDEGINGWVTSLFLESINAEKAAQTLEQDTDCHEVPYMGEEESASYSCEFDGGFIEVHLNFDTNMGMLDGWRTLYFNEIGVDEAEAIGTELGKTIRETISRLK